MLEALEPAAQVFDVALLVAQDAGDHRLAVVIIGERLVVRLQLHGRVIFRDVRDHHDLHQLGVIDRPAVGVDLLDVTRPAALEETLEAVELWRKPVRSEPELRHPAQQQVGMARLVHRVLGEIHLQLRVGHEIGERDDVRATPHLRRADQVENRAGTAGSGMHHAEERDHVLLTGFHPQALLLSGSGSNIAWRRRPGSGSRAGSTTSGWSISKKKAQ